MEGVFQESDCRKMKNVFRNENRPAVACGFIDTADIKPENLRASIFERHLRISDVFAAQ
jgi:hypothetical protein